MSTEEKSGKRIVLGPLLTLLLSVLHTRGAWCDRARALTAADPTLGEGKRLQQLTGKVRVRPAASVLGPFLTLILTLHRGHNRPVGQGLGVWEALPFVRIVASRHTPVR